jgi:hypothetical protein
MRNAGGTCLAIAALMALAGMPALGETYPSRPVRLTVPASAGEMDQMKDEALGYFEPRPWHQDVPQKPKVWRADTLGSFWGGRAPLGFGD